MTRLALPSTTGKGKSVTFDASRLVNWYARPASSEQAKGTFYLEGRPGLSLAFASGGQRVRGLFAHASALFVVADTTLYRVTANGAGVLQSPISMGEIAGFGPVQFAGNGRGELIVVAENKAYAGDPYASSLTAFTLPNGQTVSSLAVQDGYALMNVHENIRFYRSSQFRAATIDALNWAEKTGQSDLLLSMLATGGYVYLFGEESSEVWRNTGFGAFFFERITDAIMNKGIAGVLARCRFEETAAWLGDDRLVYRAQGATPVNITSPAVADELAALARVDDALLHRVEMAGHRFLLCVFPAANRTFVFDALTQSWSEWKTGKKAFDGQVFARFRGVHYCASLADGNVYVLDRDAYSDNDSEIVREAVIEIGPAMQNMTINRLELLFEAGLGGNAPQYNYLLDANSAPMADSSGELLVESVAYQEADKDPWVMLASSRDGGHTFAPHPMVSAGHQGKYRTRAVWQGLGHFSVGGAIKITVSSKTPWRLIAADATATLGAQ